MWTYWLVGLALQPYVGFVENKILPFNAVSGVGIHGKQWIVIGPSGLSRGQFGKEWELLDKRRFLHITKYGGYYYFNVDYKAVERFALADEQAKLRNVYSGSVIDEQFSVSDWGLIVTSGGNVWVRPNDEIEILPQHVIYYRVDSSGVRKETNRRFLFVQSQVTTTRSGIWLASFEALGRWNGEWREVYHFRPGLRTPTLPALLAVNDEVLVGLNGSGLFRVKDGLLPIPAPSNNIWYLRLWDNRLVLGAREGVWIKTEKGWAKLSNSPTFVNADGPRLIIGCGKGVAVFSTGGTKSALDVPPEQPIEDPGQ